MTKTRNQQGSKIFTELTKFEFLFQNKDLINSLLNSCVNGSLSSSQVGQIIYCMKLTYQDQSSFMRTSRESGTWRAGCGVRQFFLDSSITEMKKDGSYSKDKVISRIASLEQNGVNLRLLFEVYPRIANLNFSIGQDGQVTIEKATNRLRDKDDDIDLLSLVDDASDVEVEVLDTLETLNTDDLSRLGKAFDDIAQVFSKFRELGNKEKFIDFLRAVK
jgi:archaellum biogenesis ATPase FlaH